jgi:hypothetical protein
MLVRSHYICYNHENKAVLETNSIDELLKHWIPCCVNMFGKSQIELPCKPTRDNQEISPARLPLNNKGVEFSSSVAWSSQLPCHGPLCFRIHIEVESQVRHTILRKTQVESKTRRTFRTFDAEAFELCDCSFDEICMYMRRSNTFSISRISKENITISPIRSGSLDPS